MAAMRPESLVDRSIEQLRGILAEEKMAVPDPIGVMVTNRGRLPELVSWPGRRHGCFQLRHALFEFLDLGAGTRQYLGLDVEFLSGNQLEMAQSLRQDIVKIGAQILVRVYHP
jgi:hypothetical protein